LILEIDRRHIDEVITITMSSSGSTRKTFGRYPAAPPSVTSDSSNDPYVRTPSTTSASTTTALPSTCQHLSPDAQLRIEKARLIASLHQHHLSQCTTVKMTLLEALSKLPPRPEWEDYRTIENIAHVAEKKLDNGLERALRDVRKEFEG